MHPSGKKKGNELGAEDKNDFRAKFQKFGGASKFLCIQIITVALL